MTPHAPIAPGVRGLPAAANTLTQVAFLAFDIDGVLVDTHDSYPAAVEAALLWYARERLNHDGPLPIGAADLPRWKAAGGFNDDWHLAQALGLYLTEWRRRGRWSKARADIPAFLAEVAARGGGLAAVAALCPQSAAPAGAWDPNGIERVCMERYGGDEGCRAMFGFTPTLAPGPGLWRRERPLVDRARLLPWRGRLGLYTGRNDGETVFALRAAGLEDLFPEAQRHTTDRGYRKPDPAGLRALAAACSGILLFAGDTPDDLETVRRYRSLHPRSALPRALFAGVLGGAPGPAAEAIFEQGGADIIARDTPSLLAALHPPA